MAARRSIITWTACLCVQTAAASLAAEQPGRLRLDQHAVANNGEVLVGLEAVLERFRPDAIETVLKPCSLGRLPAGRALMSSPTWRFSCLAPTIVLHRGRGELQRLVHAGEAIDLDLVIDVDHLADGAESRGVHEDGIARLDAGLAVGGLELDHRVLHLEAADFAAVAGGHGRSEVAAVAEVFVGRPGPGDPRRRPGTGRRVGHGDALFHARRTRRRGRGGRGRLAGEGPGGRVA